MSPRERNAVRRGCLRLLGVTAGALLVAGTAACSAPADSPPPAQPTVTAVSVAAYGDGVLVLGTILPTTGAAAALGPVEIAAVELAIRDINDAGGVNGAPVAVYHRDSSDSSEAATAAFDDLAAHHVDALVGPSSAGLARLLLPAAARERIPLVSAVLRPDDLGHAPEPTGWLFGVSAVPSSDGGGTEPAQDFATRLRASDPSVIGLRSGPEAYDATILLALAAAAAGGDDGESIARRLADVSSGGYPCASFGDCLAALAADQDIDYRGVSGPLDLDDDGWAAGASGS